MNDNKKIIDKLIEYGNNAEWAKQAVAKHIMYLNRVYGKVSVKQAAVIIRTIAD